jgi:hypothetical protein
MQDVRDSVQRSESVYKRIMKACETNGNDAVDGWSYLKMGLRFAQFPLHVLVNGPGI